MLRVAETLPTVRGIVGPWSHNWPDVAGPGERVNPILLSGTLWYLYRSILYRSVVLPCDRQKFFFCVCDLDRKILSTKSRENTILRCLCTVIITIIPSPS